MGLFRKHYLGSQFDPVASDQRRAASVRREIAQVARIICDEELLRPTSP
jgi:hypothetical protein